MNNTFTLRASALVFALGASMSALAGCAAEDFELAPVEDLEMQSVSESGEEITTSYPAGTSARTTSSLNLRRSNSTSSSIILVMPSGARVSLITGRPQSGWYNISFNGYTGWAYGSYLSASAGTTTPPPSGGGTTPPPSGGGSTSASFAGMLSRASSGEGFSYWWGHGRWLDSGPTSSTRGSCSGSCPSCTHGGSYGADCSGFVAKIWMVPSSNSNMSVDSHPYSTASFVSGSSLWSRVNRANVQPGDALTYNLSGRGHMVWVRGGDGWGSMDLYEARGCSYGIVRNTRSLGSDYIAIRRN
ncbi:MAG: SH3 domain-containing protein [Deltaproteobacteria bacterium]|nr:SH3 domain-containing protein [Deltaproteobacteria bacterium]